MSPTLLPPLEISSWTEASLSSLLEHTSDHLPLILIDGAAGSGKTTLAAKLAALRNANLVHTDDVSWCADPICWDDELLTGIIAPWRGGKRVSFRPTGWIKENRPGSIDVDPDKALIIEGMGVCRKTLRTAASRSIWVDTVPEVARARVVQRDLSRGENGGTVASIAAFADWWDSLLTPLFLEEEPWKYVNVIVDGSRFPSASDHIMVHTPCF